MSIGFTEILLILVVVLILFGSKRIPEVARALGRASEEFKKAKAEIKKESAEFLDMAEKNAEVEVKEKK
ncbi:MAG: twin-arginine translocase TatA/TatE family subunit [Deltaproteobacteria bacterium]|jgi:sec-independent protein translocase protein TatA|nr:twin-arginine translocase TatA/TatE family subunit [Deltaproteobacteria bacterium]